MEKKSFTKEEALQLVHRCRIESEDALSVLTYARGVAQRAGLTVDSSVVQKAYQCNTALATLISANNASQQQPQQQQPSIQGNPHSNSGSSTTVDITTKTLTDSARNQIQLYGRMRGGINCFPLILETTQGYSNTDHVVSYTGDRKVDQVAEYKRSLRRRARAMCPEDKGEQRWDQPRMKGSRRRRIKRNRDLPSAPSEPPLSSYVLFVSQMTTKLRHDRGPQIRHNQIEAVGEISRMWKFDMTESERNYYTRSVREMREEYIQQLREFRATGYYTPSQRFTRLLGHGPFVRLRWEEKNNLEKELSTYKEIVRPGSVVLKANTNYQEDDEEDDDINILDERSIISDDNDDDDDFVDSIN